MRPRAHLAAVLLLAVLTLIASGCSAAHGGLATRTSGSRSAGVAVRPTRLVTFGHSYVVGVGASTPAKSWVQLAAAGVCLPLADYGVSGQVGSQVAADVHSQPLRPDDIVAVQVGINDARLYGTDPARIADYGKQITDILDTLAHHQVVLVTAQPLVDYGNFAPFDQGSAAAVAAYNAELATSAGRFAYAHVVTPTWDPATDIAPDTVHPNDAGHAAIAAAVDRELSALGAKC